METAPVKFPAGHLLAGSVVVVLGTGVASLLLPLYFVTTSAGDQWLLWAWGWAGDGAAAWAVGAVSAQDYGNLWVASVVTLAGTLAALALATRRQDEDPAAMWGVLAAVAFVPLVSACCLLGTDGFPMPFLAGTLSGTNITVAAGWGAPLWASAAACSWASGGAVSHLFARSCKDYQRWPTVRAEDIEDVVESFSGDLLLCDDVKQFLEAIRAKNLHPDHGVQGRSGGP